MRTFLRNNSLGLVFGALFLATLVAQSAAGWQSFNDEHLGEGLATISYADYVTSTDFAVAVAENWQSEFLQFLLYVLATVWFLQQGSPESKELHRPGLESDEDQLVGRHARPDSPRWAATGGWRTTLYAHSLSLAVGAVFLLSWLAQSVAGWASENEHRLEQLRDPLSWAGYVASADFWERTLQNWQSEFLAVGSFAVLAIFLRERGSSQSKPVGQPHRSTGVEG